MKLPKNKITLKKIRKSENSANSLITKKFFAYLEAGDVFITLLLEAIERFNTVVVNNKEFRRRNDPTIFPSIILAINVVNQLEGMRFLLMKGLWQPFIVLSRAVFETTTLALYLSTHPEDVSKWSTNQKIRMSTIRKGLPNTDSYSFMYDTLSAISHPNLESSMPHMRRGDIEGAPSLYFAMGGLAEDTSIKAGAQLFIGYCAFVADAFIKLIFSKYGDSSDWEELYRRTVQASESLSGLLSREYMKKVESDFQEAVNKFKNKKNNH